MRKNCCLQLFALKCYAIFFFWLKQPKLLFFQYNARTKLNSIHPTKTKTKKTGSLFELTGGSPQLGFPITATIAAIGLPLSVFLIYAAILKGAAETEEADREFNRPRRL